MTNRQGFGYVVQVDGAEVVLNLNETHHGRVVGHSSGVSVVGHPGDLIGVDGGSELVVMRVAAIAFTEPREAHKSGVGTSSLVGEPLRQIRAYTVGVLTREDEALRFQSADWHHPTLGAQAFPLTTDELKAVILGATGQGPTVQLGFEVRNESVPVNVDINQLLGRHVAVLGASGQGKTYFVASLLQQLSSLPLSRIVVFDVNGEYARAFETLPVEVVRRTYLGRPVANAGAGWEFLRIPYYALGRQGLFRLLMPSERTQAPALRFAIEHLKYVESDGDSAGPVGQPKVLVDDGRQDGAPQAYAAMQAIRSPAATVAAQWPHMRAISCLAAEWYALGLNRQNQPARDGFLYGHLSALINRVRALLEDDRFQAVVDVCGGAPAQPILDWRAEADRLVTTIFGGRQREAGDWKIHIINLNQLTPDLMPFVLGSLLELYASELFRRGPGQSYPTLLVLEEAHHYLRELPGDTETGLHSLAYERLAKEGRKFYLSLLVSTQRPSELSPTVLSQCGTWCVLRLTNENDIRAVSSAGEWTSSAVLRQIPVLSRGQAVVFGAATPIPWRISLRRPDPEPQSNDADFARRWLAPQAE